MTEEQQNANTIDDLDPLSENVAPLTEEEGQVEKLQQALAAKAKEVNSLNDKYLRLAAEFDNYKRLTQRDQRDQIRFGNEQIMKKLFPVGVHIEQANYAWQK